MTSKFHSIIVNRFLSLSPAITSAVLSQSLGLIEFQLNMELNCKHIEQAKMQSCSIIASLLMLSLTITIVQHPTLQGAGIVGGLSLRGVQIVVKTCESVNAGLKIPICTVLLDITWYSHDQNHQRETQAIAKPTRRVTVSALPIKVCSLLWLQARWF